jgi:hypothetical protein
LYHLGRKSAILLLFPGAISWDGSFDWRKRSVAINKTRPNDAPPLHLPLSCFRQKATGIIYLHFYNALIFNVSFAFTPQNMVERNC